MVSLVSQPGLICPPTHSVFLTPRFCGRKGGDDYHLFVWLKTTPCFTRNQQAAAARCEALKPFFLLINSQNASLSVQVKKAGKCGDEGRTLFPIWCRGREALYGTKKAALEWENIPWYFLKSVESKHGDLSPHLSSPSILEFSAAFLPTCFQFALVASFDCDLNPIKKERLRWGEGKQAEGGLRECWKEGEGEDWGRGWGL